MTLEVDQTTPLGLAVVTSVDPLVLFVESGALENPHKLRALSAGGARNVLGRLLFRARDRLDPAFGDPPPDDDLSLELSAAWDVYCAGRLVRLGHPHFDEKPAPAVPVPHPARVHRRRPTPPSAAVERRRPSPGATSSASPRRPPSPLERSGPVDVELIVVTMAFDATPRPTSGCGSCWPSTS